MCNLYSMTAAREAMLRLFRLRDNRAAHVAASTAIFPGHAAAVVRPSDDGERELVAMSWGFVLPQKDRAPRRVTNARDDKVRSSAFWRDSFEARRCLVAATAFAEPREITPATWHWFALTGLEPRPLFAFAGLWRRWQGPIRKGGPPVEIDVYAFMTTTPNALVATINHERMPVLLDAAEAHDIWLRGTPDEALALCRKHPPERMRMVQSGFEKLDLLDAPAPSSQSSAPRTLFD